MTELRIAQPNTTDPRTSSAILLHLPISSIVKTAGVINVCASAVRKLPSIYVECGVGKGVVRNLNSNLSSLNASFMIDSIIN